MNLRDREEASRTFELWILWMGTGFNRGLEEGRVQATLAEGICWPPPGV